MWHPNGLEIKISGEYVRSLSKCWSYLWRLHDNINTNHTRIIFDVTSEHSLGANSSWEQCYRFLNFYIQRIHLRNTVLLQNKTTAGQSGYSKKGTNEVDTFQEVRYCIVYPHSQHWPWTPCVVIPWGSSSLPLWGCRQWSGLVLTASCSWWYGGSLPHNLSASFQPVYLWVAVSRKTSKVVVWPTWKDGMNIYHQHWGKNDIHLARAFLKTV
jgi:hypothetical protein